MYLRCGGIFNDLFQGSCARRTKNLRLFKAFSYNNSKPIQGLPVDHSIAYNPTGTWEKKHTQFEAFMHVY